MNNGYIVLQEWMTQELELTGNELLVYALIYGFSQDGESEFFGSRNYISNWFNISLPTVDKCLNSLVDKELVARNCVVSNGVKFNKYRAILPPVKKVYPGGKETLPTGGKETLPNNININNTKNNNSNINNFLGSIPTKQPNTSNSLYSKCVNLIDSYTTNVALRQVLMKYLNLRLEMKDKPLYTNMWKGLLNKLDSIVKENHLTLTQQIQVVEHSIERGYASFFAPNNLSTNKNKSVFSEGTGISSDAATQEDINRFKEELDSQGKRTSF